MGISLEDLKKAALNPILRRVTDIDNSYLEGIDLDKAPIDPEEFYQYFLGLIKGCQDCSLCSTRTTVVAPDGPITAPIMVVGEGPGFLEDLSGIPLVGPMELRGSRCFKCSGLTACYDGKLLKDARDFPRRTVQPNCKPNIRKESLLKDKTFYLRSAGSILDGILLNRWKFAYPRQNWIDQYNLNNEEKPWEHKSPWFITNMILCRSFDPTLLKDTEPGYVSRNACKKWLTYQWSIVQPKIIVALGRQALGVILKSKEAAKLIAPNEIIDSKYGPVIFQYHPAYYMRGNQKEVRAYGYAKLATTLEKALDYVGLPI